jgi:hypothetical protein
MTTCTPWKVSQMRWTIAATELEHVAEFEHEGISANGEAGDFEEAYRSFQRAESYAGLALNAANLYRQATLPLADRAPLYRDGNPEIWRKSADHVVDQVNSDGPNGFAIWECADVECAPTDED